jgi:type II secretory pathway predicted ATPase ExeA
MMSSVGALTLASAPSPVVLQHHTDAAPSPAAPIWNEAQRLALVSLSRAVDEQSVFAALIGREGSRTSAVLNKLMLNSKQEKRICVAIPAPNRMSAGSVKALEATIGEAVTSLSGNSVHILFGIDNAHTATGDLLDLLNRFARVRACLGAPQVVLAGEPELWDRLDFPRYESLRRRFALRCSLDNELH